METLLVTVKDPSKKDFLLALLAELDFVQVKISEELLPAEEDEEPYSFFDSAGLLEGREIDAEKLRKAAWKR